MTDKTKTELSGEARLQARRARFWRFCFIGFAVALVFGGLTGYLQDHVRDGTVPLWVMVALWVVLVAGFAWYTVGYFRRVDELDLQDNLWAAMIGFYFFAAALPSWLLFHDLDVFPEPNSIIIYAATMAVMFAAYGLRKLGLR